MGCASRPRQLRFEYAVPPVSRMRQSSWSASTLSDQHRSIERYRGGRGVPSSADEVSYHKLTRRDAGL